MRNYTAQEQQLLQERGLYATIAPLLVPLLEKKEKELISFIVTDFRQGKTEFLAKVSQLATLFELKEEIKNKEQQIKSLEAQARSNS